MAPADFIQYGALGLLGFVLWAASRLTSRVVTASLKEFTKLRENVAELNTHAALSARELERIRRAVEGSPAKASETEPAPPFPAESMPVPRDRDAPTQPGFRRKLTSRE